MRSRRQASRPDEALSGAAVTTLHQLAVAILVSSAIVRPAPAPPSLSADELRERFNAVSTRAGLVVVLGPWQRGSPTATRSTARVAEHIALVADLDGDRVRSLVVLMRGTDDVDSVDQMMGTLAATLYAVSSGASDAAREDLNEALGLYDENWGARGLETVATLRGVTYRIVHPAGDSLFVLMVSFPAPVAARHSPVGPADAGIESKGGIP
ncbi:MAG: hypothetical protein ACJ79O_25490 [Myxococcales bacterium]